MLLRQMTWTIRPSLLRHEFAWTSCNGAEVPKQPLTTATEKGQDRIPSRSHLLPALDGLQDLFVDASAFHVIAVQKLLYTPSRVLDGSSNLPGYILRIQEAHIHTLATKR